MKCSALFVVTVAGFALSAPAIAGPDWQENGDAGGTILSAQRTLGEAETIRTISGSFSSGLGLPDYEDVYLIRILQPETFRIEVLFSSGTVGLYLFNVTLANEGLGLLGSTQGAQGINFLTPIATDGTQARVSNPGIYAIAVTVPGWWPVSRTGQIFSIDGPEISGPDGPGGLNPLQGWGGDPGPVGEYAIELTGSGFVDVPAPGVGMIIGAGLAGLTRRRR